MSTQTETQADSKPTRRPDLQSVRIPYWLTEKATDELTSWEQLVVYCWIYDHNGFAIRNGGNIYGKHTYDTYHREITRDLNIRKPGDIIKKLIRAKWIAESWAAPFKGKTMKGYRCLLDAKQKEDVRTEQQQLHLPDEEEENATIIESSQPTPDGTLRLYAYGGQYWYLDPSGQKVPIPEAAYNEAATLNLPDNYVYDFEADRWTDPANLTPTESEF